ncbi:MAG TPA: type IV pilus assembly protein PilM [Candidatus Saccharimonadales bacterium]|nr:type IV pilus assembly protein PilM [Candidatus Saccharimonadales bacterium]
MPKKNVYFFHDKPFFGLDIGNGSLKVMQVGEKATNNEYGSSHKLVGYGATKFDPKAIDNGVVVAPEIIAKSMGELFKHGLIGDITTRRVAVTIPAYRTFTRNISLPRLGNEELDEAVRLEAEQYIPVPLEDLYIDYEIINQTEDTTELFAVAVPRDIVDSYLELSQIMGLEAVLVETTINASSRLFAQDSQSDIPTVIIDFGSLSADMSIFDKHVLVTGTVQGGGRSFTDSIQSKLGVSNEEAGLIKTRYGLGASKRQSEIMQALEPTLKQIIKEIHRMIRYYEERYGNEQTIKQVITLGGGANMPGLTDYLTSSLRLAVRRCEPWQYLDVGHLKPPEVADKPMFATVAGLSVGNYRKLFD